MAASSFASRGPPSRMSRSRASYWSCRIGAWSGRLLVLRETCAQHESNPADGLLADVRIRIAQLRPETANMHVHDIGTRIEMEVPHFLEQLGARHDFVSFHH